MAAAMNAEQDAKLRLLQKELEDRGSKYTQLIFGLGYGGILALWAGTRQFLTARLSLTAASLVLASLLVFIFFEVSKTWLYSTLSIKLSAAIDTQDSDHLHAYEAEERRLNRRFAKMWKFCFWFSVITGFGGGAILLTTFIRGILRGGA